jgi:hypothetical protein
MKSAFTGAMDDGMDAQSAYFKSFENLTAKTKYWDPTSSVDLRSQAGFKATTPTQGGAGTAGYAMIPIYLSPMVVDETRKRTPLVELIARVTNLGLTADYNNITAKGAGFTAKEDAAFGETDDTMDRNSVAIKYLYSVGRVLGQALAGQPAFVLEGFQGTGSGLGGSAFGNASAPNANQLRILTAARALKELEESLIVNGDASTDSTEFSGIVKQQGTENVKDLDGAALTYDDIEEAVQYSFDDGGIIKLAIGSSAAVRDVRKIILDTFRYSPSDIPGGVLPFGVPSAVLLQTMVGPVPLIPSMYLSNTSGAKQIYFLDTDYIEMRVLQDMTYEKLAKTNDSDKFFLKIYECLVMKNPAFNAFIDNIL